jgi:hypothetical protein
MYRVEGASVAGSVETFANLIVDMGFLSVEEKRKVL